MELSLGAGMAFLAGATDVYGVVRLNDLYVSFMSGNTTMFGMSLGHADWPRARLIGGLITMFVLGAAGGTVLSIVAGPSHRFAVSLAVTLLLSIPVLLPAFEIPAFVVAMGALNAFMNSVDGVAISLTYVTGTLVKIGQGLGRAACGQVSNLTWLWQLPMWFSLLAGAVAAVLARQLGADVPAWPLPVWAAFLTAAALLFRPDKTAGDRGRLRER